MLSFRKISDNEYRVVFDNRVNCGDLTKDVDGYFVYWPDEGRTGYFASWLLKAVADKLDELNREWDKEVQAICHANSNQP